MTIAPAPKNVKLVRVETLMAHLMCSAEGCDGEMLSMGGGHVDASHPPKYRIPHKCSKCGLDSIEGESFPHIVHREQVGEKLPIERLQELANQRFPKHAYPEGSHNHRNLLYLARIDRAAHLSG